MYSITQKHFALLFALSFPSMSFGSGGASSAVSFAAAASSSSASAAAAPAASSSSAVQPVEILFHEKLASARSFKEALSIIKTAKDDEVGLSVLLTREEFARKCMEEEREKYTNDNSSAARLHKIYWAQQVGFCQNAWALTQEHYGLPRANRRNKEKLLSKLKQNREQFDANKIVFFKEIRPYLVSHDANDLPPAYEVLTSRCDFYESTSAYLLAQKRKLQWQSKQKEVQWQKEREMLLAENQHLRSFNNRPQVGTLPQAPGGPQPKPEKKRQMRSRSCKK